MLVDSQLSIPQGFGSVFPAFPKATLLPSYWLVWFARYQNPKELLGASTMNLGLVALLFWRIPVPMAPGQPSHELDREIPLRFAYEADQGFLKQWQAWNKAF